MKWNFQKFTLMIVGFTVFLFSGWIMNLVKLVNDGDLQSHAGVTLARVVDLLPVD